MKALTVQPGRKDSLEIRDLPEPPVSDGSVLVECMEIGLCGTDVEIIAGEFGEAPRGTDFLVLGHESVGRVVEAPTSSGFATGDLVVGMVRRLGSNPCEACLKGEWDMCRGHEYVEHGIKQLHGFARERWRTHPESLVRLPAELGRLGVLLEPASIVAKAWENITHISRRSVLAPSNVVVTGAGPIGLLAALLGVQRGFDVHVFDIFEDGLKPSLVRALGATYHHGRLSESGLSPDIAIDCSGSATVIEEVVKIGGPGGVTCLVGFPRAGTSTQLDLGLAALQFVLGNRVLLGSMNANARHFSQAAAALTAADPAWLERMLTRRIPLEQYREMLPYRPDDVKIVLDFAPHPI
jgi:threonine dehydrogenase-like Zn-dependent dehydrogenase